MCTAGTADTVDTAGTAGTVDTAGTAGTVDTVDTAGSVGIANLTIVSLTKQVKLGRAILLKGRLSFTILSYPNADTQTLGNFFFPS